MLARRPKTSMLGDPLPPLPQLPPPPPLMLVMAPAAELLKETQTWI